ncbi:MAG: FAD-dependent monooxygenase, partial [Candidatus Anammoxibacter sp.]
AESHGAEVINATVMEIDIPNNFGDPVDLVIVKNGIRKNIQADLVVGAFGLNTRIVKRILGWKTKYRPPYSVRACNTELHLGKSFIEKRFGNNIYCFSLGIDPIKFASFTPKGDYVTVSLIGKKDVTKRHLVKLLKHPVVQGYLPDYWKIPRNLCICFPKLPVTHSKNPFADRMVIIGDASISRFYKSGIESAFTTAQLAAETAFECGVARSDFKNHYYKNAKRLLARDNFYGHIIYNINGIITSRRHLVTPHLQYAKNKKDSWVGAKINEALWGMVTGNIPYKKIFWGIANPRFQITLLPTTILAICKSFKSSVVDAYQFRHKKKLDLLAKKGLGPLEDSDTVVIIGGGPAGSSCAISLLSQAEERGIKLHVVLYEWKQFDDITHNECAGVLSPPIKEILENDLGIPFPRHLIESHIRGYNLHVDDDVIKLDGGYDEISYGVLRQKFDRYMLDKAEEAGAEIITSRVTDIEIGANKVTIYSETKHTRADVVVGAFGLEEGSGQILERESKYLTPRHLLTILAKFHPKENFVKLGEDKEYIHAFLPAIKDIEFGAVTPKEDHYTINIAGATIHTHSMEKFLELKNVQKVLPPSFPENIEKLDFHRGCFPISPAKHLFGNRYVVVGDAAGLIRPFKGKGINSACLMGIKAAEVMMNVGVSKTAFKDYFNHFSEIIKDLPYARAVRRTIITAANLGYLSII